VSTISGELYTTKTDLSTISGELYTTKSDVSTISGELYTTKSDVSTISGELYTTKSDVSTISGELYTTKSDVSTISGELYNSDVLKIGNIAKKIGIGYGATNPQNNSIVINASNTPLSADLSNAFYVKPIRQNSGTNALFYNNTSGEITFDTIATAGVSLGDFTILSNEVSNRLDTNKIRIGLNAGLINQNNHSIAIGTMAGNSYQSNNAISIGSGAGNTSQYENAIAIGNDAGGERQFPSAIAIGYQAGQGQRSSAIAIGSSAGYYAQGTNSISIGGDAGKWSLPSNANSNYIAIGTQAGFSNQGTNSIAIGAQAGKNHQVSNSIIINAKGEALNATTNSGLYIAPIRDTTAASRILMYNNATFEINTFSTLYYFRYMVNSAGNQTIYDGIGAGYYHGWPFGTPVREFIGVYNGDGSSFYNTNHLTNETIDITAINGSEFTDTPARPSRTFNNCMWNAPLSGIWEISVYLRTTESDNNEHIAYGNYTKRQLINTNNSTSTVYIGKNDKILIGGHRRGDQTVVTNTKPPNLDLFPQNFISFKLLIPMEFSSSVPPINVNYTNPAIP
jgi:hypothetical protein